MGRTPGAGRLRWMVLGGLLLLAGGSAGVIWSDRVPVPVRSLEVPASVDVQERIRVEVLNGGGRQHMARLATDRLRERGFDVVYYGNASSFGRDSSVVFDRVGRGEWAQAVAAALGIEAVRSEPDPALLLDVTVLLGSEWGPAAEASAPAGGTGEQAAWWDPRRFRR
jgi:hypothetical protein